MSGTSNYHGQYSLEMVPFFWDPSGFPQKAREGEAPAEPRGVAALRALPRPEVASLHNYSSPLTAAILRDRAPLSFCYQSLNCILIPNPDRVLNPVRVIITILIPNSKFLIPN